MIILTTDKNNNNDNDKDNKDNKDNDDHASARFSALETDSPPYMIFGVTQSWSSPIYIYIYIDVY